MSLMGLCVEGRAGPGKIIIEIGCKKYFITFLLFFYDIVIFIVELTQRAIKYNKRKLFYELLKKGQSGSYLNGL